MKHHRLQNYRLFLLYSSFVSFALGLFVPFYIVFVQGLGNIESFGIAMGLMALAGGITSYFVGHHSDKLGRKGFLIFAQFTTVIILVLYTFVTSLPQLYVLQVINGIIQEVEGVMSTTLLADITEKYRRGTDVGKLRAITAIVSAIAMMGGGYVVGKAGINIIFYITAGLIFVGTLFLFNIKER